MKMDDKTQTNDVSQNKMIKPLNNYYTGKTIHVKNTKKEDSSDFNVSNDLREENYHNNLNYGKNSTIFVNKMSDIQKPDCYSANNDLKKEENIILSRENIKEIFGNENIIMIKQNYKHKDIFNEEEGRRINEEAIICLSCLNSTAIGYIILFCKQKNEKIYPLCLNCISNHAKDCLEDCHKRLIYFDDEKNNTNQTAFIKYNDYKFCPKIFKNYISKALKDEILTALNDIVNKSMRKFSKKIHKKTLVQNKNETFLQFINKNKNLLNFQIENISKNNTIIKCEPLNLRKMNYVKQKLSDFFELTIQKIKNIFHKIYDSCVCNYKEEKEKEIIMTKYKDDEINKKEVMIDKNDSYLIPDTNKNKLFCSPVVDITKQRTNEITKENTIEKNKIYYLRKRQTNWRTNDDNDNHKTKEQKLSTITYNIDHKIKRRGRPPLSNNIKSKYEPSETIRKRGRPKKNKNDHAYATKTAIEDKRASKDGTAILNDCVVSDLKNNTSERHEKQEKLRIASFENENLNELSSINFS